MLSEKSFFMIVINFFHNYNNSFFFLNFKNCDFEEKKIFFVKNIHRPTNLYIPIKVWEIDFVEIKFFIQSLSQFSSKFILPYFSHIKILEFSCSSHLLVPG